MFLVSRLLAVSLLIGVLWLTGCGQAAQTVVEQATGGKVDIRGQLPEEFKGFPVPEGLKAGGALTVAAGKEQGAVASWTGRGTVASVVGFYKRTLAEQGWKEEFTMDTGTAGSQLGFAKGDNVVVLTIAAAGEDVTVSAIMAKGQQSSGQSLGTSGTSGQAGIKAPAVPDVKVPGGGPAIKPPVDDAAAKAKVPAPPKVDASLDSAPKVAPPKAGASGSPALPPELGNISAPGGFTIEPDSVQRLAVGGAFGGAVASWVGRGDIKEVAAFYRRSITSGGWREEAFLEQGDSTMGLFSTTRDGGLKLALQIEKDEDEIRVNVSVTR